MKTRINLLAIISTVVLIISNLILPSNKVVASGYESWLWPSEKRYISSNYGWRTINGEEKKHTGIDILAPYNSPVMATKSGTIVSGYSSMPDKTIYKDNTRKTYGNYTTIKHDDGSGYSTYMHMLPGNKISGHVSQGEVIGNCGMTGYSTGYHIHFEVVTDPNNRYSTSVNTMPANPESEIYVKHKDSYKLPAGWPTQKMTYVFTPGTSQSYSSPVITVSGFNAPQNLAQGSSFGLYGTATTSSGIITSVEAKILNSSLGITVYPNSSSYSVRSSYTGGNTNNALAFNLLGYGSYTLYYKIVAVNGNKTSVKELWYDFTVSSRCPTFSVTTSISYPTSLKKGSCFGVRGVISVDAGCITYLRAYVVGTSQDYCCYPYSQSTNLRYNGANDRLLFNKLKKGTYIYRIEAIAQNGNEVATFVFERQFTVK